MEFYSIFYDFLRFFVDPLKCEPAYTIITVADTVESAKKDESSCPSTSQQSAEEISQPPMKRPRIDENIYVSKFKQNCNYKNNSRYDRI